MILKGTQQGALISCGVKPLPSRHMDAPHLGAGVSRLAEGGSPLEIKNICATIDTYLFSVSKNAPYLAIVCRFLTLLP